MIKMENIFLRTNHGLMENGMGNYVNGEYFYAINGDYAVGTFKDGFLVEGKYNYKKSGDYAVGIFKNGLLVNGRYTFLNGNWSEGTFQEFNLIDGTEFHKYKNGQECFFVYEGGLKIKVLAIIKIIII